VIAKKNNQKLPRVPIINMSVQINGSNKVINFSAASWQDLFNELMISDL